MRMVIALAALTSALSPVDAREPFRGLVTIPKVAGDLFEKTARVRYVSDGRFSHQCSVIRSSGNPIADEQACKTVSFQRTTTPIETDTIVWLTPTISGIFVEPDARNDPRSWLTYRDFRGTGSGTAVVQLDIDEVGKVVVCKVLKSSGVGSIDKMAESKFCRRVKFYPATLNGKAVPVLLLTTIIGFTLD